MRISTIGYQTKQGFKNIGRNKMFSVASIATMAGMYLPVWYILFNCNQFQIHGSESRGRRCDYGIL